MIRRTFNNNSHRLLRVNELIKREISIFLQGMEWTDYGLEGLNLTLTDVECSKDIRIAKIFYIPEGIKNSDLIEKAKADVVKSMGFQDGYVRPIAWRGTEMMGVSAQNNTIHLAITAWEWPSYFDPEAKTKGIKMGLSRWKRPAPDTAPTQSKASGLYQICTMAKHEAEAAGMHDALMLDYRGLVAEATGANIFFVMDDGKLHTPVPDCFLDGITRRTVIDLAKRRGFEIVERQIKPEEMANASECFLTGTAVEVTPVGQIDKYSFTPGEVCNVLGEDYSQLVRGEESAVAAE